MKKVFFCEDTDGGNSTYVIAESIRKAIDLFNTAYGYDPETIRIERERTLVIIQDLYEPTLEDMKKIWGED